MPRRTVNRFQILTVAMLRLLPAWLLFALAGVLVHPLSLVLLLAADAVAITAICDAAGLRMETAFARSIARRGLTFFVQLTAYAALVAALVAMPAWWLAHDGSLVATLTFSATLAIALFALVRLWPMFALPFVWDDAYPRSDETSSWLLTALRRCAAFARHLSREHELYLSYGLPSGLALLVLAAGALALAGLGGFLAGDARTVALFLYAIVLVPAAGAVLVNRCLRALLSEARATRPPRGASQLEPGSEPAAIIELPAGVSRSELDGTLLCALRSTQPGLALAALERGANADALPGEGQRDQRTALVMAVTLPDLRLLRALIARGADVNRVHAGITPLIAATRDSYEGRPEAVTTLLANGADARIADGDGNTPLHHAARCAEPIVAALLLDAAADINALDGQGATALAIACANTRWPIARFLLEHGAKPDLAGAQPALLAAASIAEDDASGARLLLRNRAQVDGRGALERTALMAAALAGHAAIAEALLAAGAQVDLVDHRGTTALMEAARAGSAAVIHALGKRKADADHVDAAGRTALIIACQSRHANEDAVRALLAIGADRARPDAEGRRALDHAAAAGRWHVVALLDPAYPLPSSLAGGALPAHAASADHLLDALRFGHWNIADEFVPLLAGWSPAALADLYLALAVGEHTSARCWLLNHGLDGDARVGDGRRLDDALVDGLPATADALRERHARGAPTGGASLLARVLAASAPGTPLASLGLRLLDDGADWCGAAPGGRSSLHLAVSLADPALATALLDRGADPNARDARGCTPLHIAAAATTADALPMLQSLLMAGGNPEIASATGETALGLALARAETGLARWLSWTGWRLPLRRLCGADLAAAAAAGDFDAVERLLDLGLPLESTDAQGATALIRAAGSGHAALVVRLLEAGADPAHSTPAGVHALAAATGARRETVVRTLLSHGVAPDLAMVGGATALMLASALGQPPIVAALLEAGADPAATDEHGGNALLAVAQFAFEGGGESDARAVMERLLAAGVRADACNRGGQDALLVLLGARAQPGTRCDAEQLRRLAGFLLESGARVDLQDQRGVSALHACALHGLAGCARLLKAHGASLAMTDAFGRTAADVAAMLGYVDVAAELGLERAAAMPGARQTLRRPARAPE